MVEQEINDIEEEIEDKEEFLENYSERKKISVFQKIKNCKKEKPKKFWSIIGIISVAIIVAISIIVPVAINSNRKEKEALLAQRYDSLILHMDNFGYPTLLNSISQIQTDLNNLPEDYKDVAEIKKQFYQIKKQADVFMAIFGLYGHDLDNERARKSYENLSDMDDDIDYSRWNFTDFFDNVYVADIIFGVKWEGDYYFYWYEASSSYDTRLSSNIPNDKEDEKEYYYTIDSKQDYVIFGYKNQSDENEKFNAFKVFNLRYKNDVFYVDVYCYKNQMKYTLTYKD